MSRRKTHPEFLAQIEHRLGEYEVLSEYKSATEYVFFRHKKCGRIIKMKPMHFVYGKGCRDCAYEEIGRKKTHTYKEFRSALPSKYYGWSFSGYSGATSPIVAICPECGRKHKYKSAEQFVVGAAGCKACAMRMGEEELKKNLDRLGWTLIERLQPKKTKKGYNVPQLRVKCVECGNEKVSHLSNLRRYKCEVCSGNYHGQSKEEGEVYSWLSSIIPEEDICRSDRSILKSLARNGQELDFYIPSKKVAIEYNGRYWHSSKVLEKKKNVEHPKKYHYNKSKACEDQGIRLIHIWDYEWQDPRKQKVLKNIILGALGMLPERYYARNCEVKKYDKDCPRWKELNQFFAENNIQGNRGGSVVFTLEKDGRILMAYKFGRPSGGLAKKKYQYEMVRGASAPGVQVVGGASKLWKHFVQEMKPKSVVYYIDFNYFDGRSVEKLGGKLVGSQPGVKNYWVETGEVKNREPRRHREIQELIKDGKVLELWNAGTKTYSFEF